MIILRPTFWLMHALLIVILTSTARSEHVNEVLIQEDVTGEDDPLSLLQNGGDNVDLVVIDADEDPRGVVLRRWRRLIRSTIFRPGKYFKKILAALVVPGTIAGAIAGTVASSIVGVGAGGFTGSIAGAGLGGIAGILIPAVALKKDKTKRTALTDISKASAKKKKKKKKESSTKDEEVDETDESNGNGDANDGNDAVAEEEENDDGDDDDDSDEEDDGEDDDEDDEEDEEEEEDDDESRGLGRTAAFTGSGRKTSADNMLLLLRGTVNVDRLYELRQKMKLLKIKNRFKTKQRHYLWN